MNIEDFREFCISKTGVTESFPFDDKTLVFKVGGKIFTLIDVENFRFANLKCDPERAEELRDQFNGINPGYHMNKKHWNSVYVNSDVPDNLFYDLIAHSYELIFNSLSVKVKESLS